MVKPKLRLRSTQNDFATRFAELLTMKRETAEDVSRVVAEIIANVRARGDIAVLDYTRQFDRVAIDASGLRFTQAEIDRAENACDAELLDALDLAAQRIEDYHAKQKPQDALYSDEVGMRLGHRWRAVETAGLYVPGGTAAYPSSVLMNAIPAKTAEVERVVMCVPTPDGVVNPLVLAAAKRARVDEIYRIGGAQAIAAMAYGTDTIAPVNVIVGPGNAYVAAAKRAVFGQVGIDMVAGPSEVLVVADAHNNPDWVGADLLAQAEHDESAQSIVICDDENFADAVEDAVARQLTSLPRQAIAQASWENFGAVILVDDLDAQAPALIDQLAPEHLHIALDDPAPFAKRVRNAGAIFLGRFTPEAIGDYVAGPNHVLPTARAARYASGLSVLNFMKRSTLMQCPPDALAMLAPSAVQLAQAEGLDAHAHSIAIRLNKMGDEK